MRLLLLLLLAATASAQAPASPAPPLTRQLRTLLADTQAHWGISVTTLTGQSLVAIDDAKLFRPASTAKLFTTAAALALLGKDHRWATTLAADRSPDGTARSLTLSGEGSAWLSTRTVPYAPPGPGTVAHQNPLEELADQIVAAGLRHVAGDIIGDDTAWPTERYGPDWELDDALYGYGAPVGALSANDNQVQLSVLPSSEPGTPALVSLSPIPSLFQIEASVLTIPSSQTARIGLARDPGSSTLRVTGSVAGGQPFYEDLAVEDPALFTATLFKQMLEARGVTVDGQPRATHRFSQDLRPFSQQVHDPLPKLPADVNVGVPGEVFKSGPGSSFVNRSPTLLEDVTVTLKISQNLHAEMLLRHLGQRFGTEGSGAQGARVVRQFAVNAGLSPDDFLLFDGSGLSSHDLVAPRAFTQLLTFAARQSWGPAWRAALPIGGTDGSLTTRFTGPLKGKVFAKTGTLGESRALTGYLTAASGRTLAFAILVDNHPPNTTADRTLMDRLVETIAAAE